MASAIPGPYARSDVSMVPGRYGKGTNSTVDFFAKLIPALQNEPVNAAVMKATGNYGRPKSDWTLADMNEQVTRIMMTNVEEVLNMSAEEEWYYAVCPRKTGFNALNVQVTSVFFRPSLSQEAAPRTTPRNMDIEQTIGEYGLTRMINGFQIDTETTMEGVNQGMEWFLRRVAMMQVGIMETDKYTIIAGLMNMHKAQRVKWDDLTDLLRSRSAGGVYDTILWMNEMTLSLVKKEDPLRFWREMSNADFQFLGVNPAAAMTILHEHSARVLITNDFYKNRAQGDMQALLDSRSAVAEMLGSGVNFTRNFRGNDGQSLNPVGQVMAMGLYNPVVDPHDECPDRPYRTDYRRIKITTTTNKGMMVLDPLEVFVRTGRWNLETGELNSLVDPSAWAAAGEEQRKRIGDNVMSDAYHVSIAETMFGRGTEDPGYVGPALYWGSVKTSTISTRRFQNCARSVVAELPNPNAIDEAIAEYLALVREAGAAPLRTGGDWNEAFRAAVGVAGVPFPDDVPGCKPTNPALLVSPTNPSTKFIEMAPLANKVKQMPPGFTSLAAMRYLVENSEGQLKKRLEKVVDAADQLAGMLRNKFATSVLMDPAYAPSDMAFATEADMLFTSAILPRRAVVISLLGGAAAAAAAAPTPQFQAADGLYTNAERYYADTDKAAVLQNYKPARGDTADVLTKKAIALTALRNFTKNGSGGFVVDPQQVLGGISADGTQEPERFAEDLVKKLSAVRNPKEAYSRRSSELRQSFTDLIAGLKYAGDNNTTPVLTKLLLEPSQVAELSRIVNEQGVAGVTIGTDRRQDVPANKEDLARYAAAIKNRAAEQPLFAAPLNPRSPVHDASVGAVAYVSQLREFMAENGWPVQRRAGKAVSAPSIRPASMLTASTASSRVRKMLADLKSTGVGASTNAARRQTQADPNGAMRQYFSCIDPDVDLMMTEGFAEHWDEANAMSSSLLELLIIRLYLTTSTNFDKSIRYWATNNVRIPLNAAVLRVLRLRTNPVIRVIPGESTCFLAVGFEKTGRGTEQNTGMFSINYSYYTGFIPVQPNNVQVYHNVDPAGYVSGLDAQWANFARSTPGMVAVLLPGDRLPIAISPFGPIAIDGSKGNSIEPYEGNTRSIALFEQYRQNRVRAPWSPEIHPNNPWGVPIEDPIFEHYSRDTTLYAGPDCDYKKHVPSASPIPTTYATSDLRDILDGRKTKPDYPLTLGANNELPVSV